MSKKDDRIAELEAENARLQAEIARLRTRQPFPIRPQRPAAPLPWNRGAWCPLCQRYVGTLEVHRCWQPMWTTVTSDRTVTVADASQIAEVVARGIANAPAGRW